MPSLIVSKNIVSKRLERALDHLQHQGWNPIYGRLRYILANPEVDIIREVVEAWEDSKVEDDETGYICTCNAAFTCEAHRA